MKFFLRLSVRQKLIIAMGVSVSIFVFVSTALSVFLTGEALKERAVTQELPTAVGEIRNDVLRRITGPLATAQSIASNTFLLDWEAHGLPDDGMQAWKDYAQNLKSATKATSISWISESTGQFLNEAGLVRRVSRGDSDDGWFYSFLSGGAPYEVALGKEKDSTAYSLFINARFDVDGKKGMGSLGFAVSDLADAIRSYKIGEHGFVYLARPDGVYLIHRDASLADGRHSMRDEFGLGGQAIAALLNGQKFSTTKYQASDGTRLVAASYMPELNIYVVAEVPENEVLGKIAQTSTISALVAALIGGGVGMVIIMLVSQTIAGPLRRAASMLREIADGNGDLTRRMKVESGDEVGALAASFNRFVESLSRIMFQLRESTVAISSASRQIAAGNNDLSARTETQASSLEETAAAMEQLTSTVQSNAANAREANELVVVAASRAQRGGDVVGEVVSTMNEIAASSTKIGDIIAVMDSIAFQTNILALNAAVEAARAGEQGRGFAVVASEVRALALRSASAAKEIKELIDQSSSSVAAGAQQVSKAQTSMAEIVDAVTRVTAIMGEIASASAEQGVGIGQVNQAVAQIDENTQRNAAQVQEAAAAARSMEEQATSLSHIVGMFQIDESSQVG